MKGGCPPFHKLDASALERRDERRQQRLGVRLNAGRDQEHAIHALKRAGKGGQCARVERHGRMRRLGLSGYKVRIVWPRFLDADPAHAWLRQRILACPH